MPAGRRRSGRGGAVWPSARHQSCRAPAVAGLPAALRHRHGHRTVIRPPWLGCGAVKGNRVSRAGCGTFRPDRYDRGSLSALRDRCARYHGRGAIGVGRPAAEAPWLRRLTFRQHRLAAGSFDRGRQYRNSLRAAADRRRHLPAWRKAWGEENGWGQRSHGP